MNHESCIMTIDVIRWKVKLTPQESQDDRQWCRGISDCSSCSAQNHTCDDQHLYLGKVLKFLIVFSHLLLHLIEDVVHHLQSILGPARLRFYLQKFWFVLSPLQKEHHLRGSKTYHMHPLVGGWWCLRKWEIYKIFHLFSCDMGNLVNFTSVLNLK